jgi:hypothetical protein
MTRRRLLATGGAAGAAAVVGFQPWSPANAQAADDDTPAYLKRASYLALSSPDFSTSRLGAGAGLKLVSVDDLSDPKLAGRDDAFVLTFRSDTSFESGTRSIAHKDFGVFELFLVPVGGNGNYEAIINRSVGLPKRPPKPPATPPEQKAPPPPKHVRAAAVRNAHVRRAGKDLVANVALDPDAHVKSVTVWLTRAGIVVAAAEVRHVRGRDRLGVRLPRHKRLRGGRYELTVGTKDGHGHTEYKRVKIALQ